MNISYLKNKNIHFVECENWHDAYGYEKAEMKEDIINYIEQLQQGNKILKENAENNDKVVDKVNWEKQLLKKKNQQLQERIEYLERSNNRREDTIFEQSQKISDLEDNWEKIKEYIKNEIPEDVFIDTEWFDAILDKMKELEGSDSNGQ